MDIITLASRIEAAQRAGWKYVLMLGAGASRSSGVAGSFELKQLILADVAPLLEKFFGMDEPGVLPFLVRMLKSYHTLESRK